MIPYIELHRIMVGPIPIQVWGLFVALGMLLAVLLAAHLATSRGISRMFVYDAAALVVVAALVGARLGHVLLYEPAYFIAYPLEIFALWHGGLSSFGGFVGGAAAGLWYIQKHKADLRVVSDLFLTALPLGWMVGRIGCFLIHDHPGTLTHSWLAVQYPGGSRFDLGLIESLIGALLFLVAMVVLNQYGKRRPGLTAAVVLIGYALLRFATDFLRATDIVGADVRWWGLTPAQYGCLCLLLGGLVLFTRSIHKK